jgi:hypothetical protein
MTNETTTDTPPAAPDVGAQVERLVGRLEPERTKQCKDIPTEPILRFLRDTCGPGRAYYWGCRFCKDDGAPEFDNSVAHAMPPNTPPKLQWAKMAKLISAGLIDGCSGMHNCRGDYEITAKGRALLAAADSKPPNVRGKAPAVGGSP